MYRYPPVGAQQGRKMSNTNGALASGSKKINKDDLYLTTTRSKVDKSLLIANKQMLQERENELKEKDEVIENLQKMLKQRDKTEDATSKDINSEDENDIENLRIENLKLSGDISRLTTELLEAKEEMEKRQRKFCELHNCMCFQLDEAEGMVEAVKERMNDRENYHQQIYLQMYRRGREAEKFEHEDDVILSAHVDPQSVRVEELLQQLVVKDGELDKLRKRARDESYYGHAASEQKLTEAEVTIKFLKSAIYYYFTERDPREHLKAILGILGYDDEQRTMIVRRYLLRENR